MPDSFVSLNEAALKLKKSVLTIRRMVKRGELEYKQFPTPQGFQYFVRIPGTQEDKVISPNEPVGVALTSQTDQSSDQGREQPRLEAKIDRIDQHLRGEIFFLLGLVGRLQVELEEERRKPRSFLAVLFDFFSKP